jgi:hypothetical protein
MYTTTDLDSWNSEGPVLMNSVGQVIGALILRAKGLVVYAECPGLPTGQRRQITLTNVVFILGFYCSVVSFKRLIKAKGLE